MPLNEMHLGKVKEFDPEIYSLIEKEKERQMEGIELIPSENLVSQAVLEALGTVPTNKYSEGYPGKRYYSGNEFIDVIENAAIDRLKKLFNAEHANVQPLSGAPANMAAFFAFMKPGDTLMGMRLDMGGHLTHGHKVNFSGTIFNSVQYMVDKETELIDFEQIRKTALETKPKLILSGYTAYPRSIDFKQFREICDETGAIAMADIAHIAGLCCAGEHENPVPYFDVVTTTTHKTLRGPRGAAIMCKKEFSEQIDKAVFPFLQGGPHENVIAAKAVAFKEAQQPSFKQYAKQIVKNAKVLAETLMEKGNRLVSGGTDNHLMLVDVSKKGLTGKEAEAALEKSGVYCNKNTIPFDPRKPWEPSGIRLGTPVVTTRGMKESEMKEIGAIIDSVLEKHDDASIKKARERTKELCKKFQFYK
ncbi:MAG: serine hydroxymethyltransferase [Candidatus Diapherotrites archaeon]|nr:serine hydroxymethyltransferase [Candidatus Diapherotrites archaeon]